MKNTTKVEDAKFYVLITAVESRTQSSRVIWDFSQAHKVKNSLAAIVHNLSTLPRHALPGVSLTLELAEELRDSLIRSGASVSIGRNNEPSNEADAFTYLVDVIGEPKKKVITANSLEEARQKAHDKWPKKVRHVQVQTPPGRAPEPTLTRTKVSPRYSNRGKELNLIPLSQVTENPKNPRSGQPLTFSSAPNEIVADLKSPRRTDITLDEFRAHIGSLLEMYAQEAEDDDDNWLENLGSLEGGAVDFAMFVQSIEGDLVERCSHGTPKAVRCESCVNEGVYTHAQNKSS